MISLIISSIIFVCYLFISYFFIIQRDITDNTKLLLLHLITLISFMSIYIITLMIDDNTWITSNNNNKLSILLEGFNFTIYQHTGLGSTNIKPNSWLGTTISMIHSFISFFINLSIFFEILERNDIDGFNLWRSFKGAFTKTIIKTRLKISPRTRKFPINTRL